MKTRAIADRKNKKLRIELISENSSDAKALRQLESTDNYRLMFGQYNLFGVTHKFDKKKKLFYLELPLYGDRDLKECDREFWRRDKERIKKEKEEARRREEYYNCPG